MDEKKLGEKIKKRREELGFSQAELASQLGLDQGMMSRIELGKRRLDAVKELPKLSRIFGVPYSWFLEDSEKTKSEITLESIIKQKFPGIELTDKEISRISEAAKGFLSYLLESDPEFNERINKSKSEKWNPKKTPT
jgi:transcriptional regulator with XRE-family HTH domain